MIEKNDRRRHLTPEQRRWTIKQAIMHEPTASDREIARQTKVDHKTVSAARAEMRGPFGEIPQRDQHRPIDRAKAVLRANPELKKREVMQAAQVGSKVAVRARRELVRERRAAAEGPDAAARKHQPRQARS